MENRLHNVILISLYLPLIGISIAGVSNGKELRPSDHGLSTAAESPETATPPQMSSFFGSGGSTTAEPLPEARNFSDPSWSTAVSGGGGGDHVRKMLMVSSLVCGTAGVALLAVVGFVFLYRYRDRRSTVVISS